MDKKDEVEVVFNPEEQGMVYVETRTTEDTLLLVMEDFYRCLIKTKNGTRDPTRLEEEKQRLQRNLAAKYNTWQDPVNPSGTSGAAFMRLIAVGILKDVPDVYRIGPGESGEFGVKVTKAPHDQGDLGVVEVVTDFGDIEDKMQRTFCKFVLNTSLSEIINRRKAINKEIEKGEIS